MKALLKLPVAVYEHVVMALASFLDLLKPVEEVLVVTPLPPVESEMELAIPILPT